MIDDLLHILTDQQQQRLNCSIALFPSFAKEGLGKTSLVQHVIEVEPGTRPIKQRHYPISPAIKELTKGELRRVLELGFA